MLRNLDMVLVTILIIRVLLEMVKRVLILIMRVRILDLMLVLVMAEMVKRLIRILI